MNKNEVHSNFLKKCTDKEKKKKSVQYKNSSSNNNKMIENIPFNVNCEVFLQNLLVGKNYIDLNLEVNYNLEDIIENKDKVNDALFLHKLKNNNKLNKNITNDKYIKNNYYNNIDSCDNNYRDRVNNRTSNNVNYVGKKESTRYEMRNNVNKVGRVNQKDNDNLSYVTENIMGNDYKDDSNSSDSDNSYCSDLSNSSAKNERMKCLNFSQRIAYDNNYSDNFNMYDKIISSKEYFNNNQKYNDTNYITSHTQQEQKTNINNLPYNKTIIYNNKRKKTRNNSEADVFYNKQQSDTKDFYNSQFDVENMKSYKSPIANFKSNADNDYLHNKNSYNNNDSIKTCKKKIEEDILITYEKIIKIMKYLRKAKTKHPEIETTVSVLSNHVKNVTFNCQKMFDSRYELQSFLKKMYIYLIFILKKVIFTKIKNTKADNSNDCTDKNISIQNLEYTPSHHENLRDHSKIPNDLSRDSNFILHQLSKDLFQKIPKNLLYKNGTNYEDKNFNIMNQKEYSKKPYEEPQHDYLNNSNITKNEKNYEYRIYNTYNSEIKTADYKYNSDKNIKEKPKNSYTQQTNEYAANKYKNTFTNLTERDATRYFNISPMKNKYEETTKTCIYKNDENMEQSKEDTEEETKKAKQMRQFPKKNEQPSDFNYGFNKINHNYNKKDIDVKNREKYDGNAGDDDDNTIIKKDQLLTKNIDRVYKDGCKKHTGSSNSYTNNYRLNKEPLNEQNNIENIHNPKNKTIYKQTYTINDVLKNNYLNIIDLQKKNETKNMFSNTKLSLNALNLESSTALVRNNMLKNEKYKNSDVYENKKPIKTYVLYYDVNKEVKIIPNKESIIDALKNVLLKKFHCLTALHNFLFKIEVELVDYKKFILSIKKKNKKLHLVALYCLNDFSVYQKVYGKKIAPPFLVSKKVKVFYKYDTFFKTFRELTNVRDFSGITDAIELI
ncbi:conserved protein, unknown function [Hepatocystis sp. ex Piliocolobus tephrosceles]|nr:conserved protein, unknown function [Hepatocystis sp. ex Piliocolobus tephrosceles]